MSGASEAWDFTVGSGMNAQHLVRSAQYPEEVLAIMEDRKKTYLDTSQQCSAAGFRFCPMVLEAHGGGWHSGFRASIDWISKNAAGLNHDNEALT